MKVLIVASGNGKNIAPFITDQTLALKNKNILIDFYLIVGKGSVGYVRNIRTFKKKIAEFKPEVIHAHYGLSGLFSLLQFKVPVIITFHGSDINNPKERFFSLIANKLCSKSIFVSRDLAIKVYQKSPLIIPCGVDLDIFYPMDKKEARLELGLSLKKKYILFSSSFTNAVKNPELALEAVNKVKKFEVELLELKGYSRNEVSLILNAVDLAILTSHSEGSPQFIKEAMATNTPIVSLDVGDVQEIIQNTRHCYLVNKNTEEITNAIEQVLNFCEKTNGRLNITYLDNGIIADRIIDVYKSVLK